MDFDPAWNKRFGLTDTMHLHLLCASKFEIDILEVFMESLTSYIQYARVRS